MRKVFDTAVSRRYPITVPAPVVAEWWRAPSAERDAILRSLRVEPLDTHLAKIAGLAIARIEGATTLDAMVMASAAQRGDVVYTSDFEDLDRLRAFFPTVRIFSA